MAAKEDESDVEMDKIEEETKEVFECFVATRLNIERDRNEIDPNTPGLPPEEISTDSVTQKIGQKLALIADQIDCFSECNLIKSVVELVKIEDENGAFKEFQDIANRVLVHGISWNSITTLFYFGYCIARDRLRQGVRYFMAQLRNWIVTIFKEHSILKWILDQGGWNQILSFTEGFNTTHFIKIMAVVCVAVACVALFARRNNS